MTDVLEVDPNVILPKLRALGPGQSTVYFRGALASPAVASGEIEQVIEQLERPSADIDGLN